MLELSHLALEVGDGANAAVDGVTEAGVGLVSEGVDGVVALVGRDLGENLADVAGAEHLVDFGELLGLVGVEVRGENAVRGAPPLQKLASRAGGAGASHLAPSSTTRTSTSTSTSTSTR